MPKVTTGGYVFLIEQQRYGYIKSQNEDESYLITIDGKEQGMRLDSSEYNKVWTNMV